MDHVNHFDKRNLIDQHSRPLRDLRISVTDRCNFRCQYCMPAELFGPDYPFLKKDDLLSFEEIAHLVRIFAKLGVEKIRLTGGEPLLRNDLPSLIEKIGDIEGIRDLALTTNGSLVKSFASALKSARLQRITISLDSLDDERFARMNGVGYKVQSILEGIEAAASVNLPIKINMVVRKGINDCDILPMARYFKERGHTLRFIEFMDVGNTNGWKLDEVVPSREIYEMIHAEMPLEPLEANYFGEVASRYRYQDGSAEIGLISSVTQAFCSSCTRARLSAEGKLYTCLFSSKGFDLRTPLRNGASDEEIEQLVRQIWQQRNDRYSELRLSQTERSGRKVEMHHIGG